MKLKIKGARLAFPALFEPTSFAGSDAKTYQAAFLIPPNHPSVKEIEAACEEVAKEKWGAKAEAVLKKLRVADKLAIHDGDTKSDYEGYAGNMFVNASNKVKPTVRDVDGKTELDISDGKPYAGCYVVGHIEIWAQDNQYGQRINASLRGVQFYKDGDAFSGSPPASDDEFDDLDAGGTDDDDLMG